MLFLLELDSCLPELLLTLRQDFDKTESVSECLDIRRLSPVTFFSMPRKRSKPAARRPRTDAQRNRERILEVAKAAFTRSGADASLGFFCGCNSTPSCFSMPPSKFLVAPRPEKFSERLSYKPFRQKTDAFTRGSTSIANVVVETVKGFLSVVAAAPPRQRGPATAEFTQMLSLYLEAKLR
jgi:hypothetical protein